MLPRVGEPTLGCSASPLRGRVGVGSLECAVTEGRGTNLRAGRRDLGAVASRAGVGPLRESTFNANSTPKGSQRAAQGWSSYPGKQRARASQPQRGCVSAPLWILRIPVHRMPGRCVPGSWAGAVTFSAWLREWEFSIERINVSLKAELALTETETQPHWGWLALALCYPG
jgi:hypothetical protein